MRWILIVLLMCNGIYFLWQHYLSPGSSRMQAVPVASAAGLAAAPISLLSELDEEQLAALTQDSDVAGVALPVPGGSGEVGRDDAESRAMCLLLGPFREAVSAKQVVSRLAALDISAQLQSIAIQGRPDYWVHLPPQLSRRAAIKLLKELQANKIDSFLITEGELENGISLGFFTERARAEKVYQQRIKEGYEPVIKAVPRSSTEIWARLEGVEYGKFSDALWEKISEGDKRLERRKNYCDKIASADDFD